MNTQTQQDEPVDYTAQHDAVISQTEHLTILSIEVCGSWLWISGDTKPNKDVLKAAGLWYAPKKEKEMKPYFTTGTRMGCLPGYSIKKCHTVDIEALTTETVSVTWHHPHGMTPSIELPYTRSVEVQEATKNDFYQCYDQETMTWDEYEGFPRQ